jgi:hypothetical protein
MRRLQSAIVPAQVAVMTDIGPQIPDHIAVVPDVRLIFPNLPFRCVIPSVKCQAIPVLLQSRFITLQLAFISAEIDTAARLR